MRNMAANDLLKGIGTLQHNPTISAVVTDSRLVTQGSLFVCMKGERVDGHNYAMGIEQNENRIYSEIA